MTSGLGNLGSPHPAEPLLAVPGLASLTGDPLLDCADEPIRIPGSVQPHGVLLAVTEPDLAVLIASSNAASMFARQVIGVRLDELLAPASVVLLRAGLQGDLAVLNPLRLRIGDVEVDLVVHRSDGLLVCECEPVLGTQQASGRWHHRLPLVLQRLAATDTLQELTQVLVTEVRGLTMFDRVMLYRFDPEWNGEVVAEDRRLDLEPFLGLHYPASDIPAQARALYAANWLRLIPDSSYRPAPLFPPVNPISGRPLDLGSAMLRSVSPVHLQYLANMGVASSMSVSLMDHDRLWGLIACHHYAGPHRPSYTDRMATEFLGRTASVLLSSKQSTDRQDAVLRTAEQQARTATALGRRPRAPRAALTEPDSLLLDLVPATGAAIRIDRQLTLLGRTPSAEQVPALVSALLASGLRSTDHLVSIVPEAEDVVDTASGLLAVEVGPAGDFLAWFRAESLREVSWAGNPDSSKVPDDSGTRLGPRKSFAAWTETVRATAAPWAPHEVAAAEQLASHLTELALRRADEDNRLALALQRTLLLEQLPHLPGVTVAARYLPAAHDVVGGDWYDIIPLPSGKVSIVLGDVAGHGLTAAAITAQLRHALRAHLLRDHGPAAALRALHDLMTALLPEELATAVVAELDPATGRVVLANAGHLPVLQLTEAGGTFVDDARGPALGLSRNSGYGETRLTLGGDDRLVLFTDGLVERRTSDLDEDLQRMSTAAQAASRDPDSLLDAVLTVMVPPRTDDVTMLVFGLRQGSSAV